MTPFVSLRTTLYRSPETYTVKCEDVLLLFPCLDPLSESKTSMTPPKDPDSRRPWNKSSRMTVLGLVVSRPAATEVYGSGTTNGLPGNARLSYLKLTLHQLIHFRRFCNRKSSGAVTEENGFVNCAGIFCEFCKHRWSLDKRELCPGLWITNLT